MSQSIASHVVFEGDFWGEFVAEFSHSLGRKRTVIFEKLAEFERPLSGKEDVQIRMLKILCASGRSAEK